MRAVPDPSDLPFMELGPQHLADPALWTKQPVEVLAGATSYLDVRYAIQVGWRPLRLDLHLPAEGAGPFPVVVYAHGGSFIGGVKELGPWADLPGRGIAVASIEYRLAGEASWPEPVEDVRAAIRWVRAHADEHGLDAGRIAGWGSSAGGYLMARAALTDDVPLGRPVGNDREVSSAVDALVLHYAPVDFGALLGDSYEPTPAGQDGVVDVISCHLGIPLAEAGDVLAAASVTAALARAEHVPPLHVSHGDGDHRCGIGQSKRLVAAWEAAGAEATLVTVPGAEHAAPIFSTPSIVDPAIDFLWRVWRSASSRSLRDTPPKGPTHDDADA